MVPHTFSECDKKASFLLIATGFDGDEVGNHSQVINSLSTNECSLPSYPVSISGGSSGTVGLQNDTLLLICGGKNSSDQILNECYNYNVEDKQWNLFAKMQTERSRHASTMFQNGSLYITGMYVKIA